MNKDVIYIEPEQDITDILANIKASKHKIVALVPPKKAGVLRSAVNFKLIAKAARQNEKTVVLITADDSLQRLAATVKMPIAKTLQSKPHLVDPEDEESDDNASSDVIEDDSKEEKEAPAKEEPKAAKTAAKEEVIEGEPDPADSKKSPKSAKTAEKLKNTKIPNFAKYRKFIIAGSIALILLVGFIIWATAIAPAAKIVVAVRTTTENFAEKVSFVKNEDQADPAEGKFFIEEKTITKTAEAEFEATGEVDKGTKATGTIVVTRPKGDVVSTAVDLNMSIPANTVVKIGDKEFIVTEGGSANATKGDVTDCTDDPFGQKCLDKNIASGKITVQAKEAGDGYNVAAATTGITLGINTTKKYSVTSSAMTGGSSKIVKVVSEEDVETAASGLSAGSEKEARNELTKQFGDDYILLGNMNQSDPKITSTPKVDEEASDNTKPKVSREVTYTMFAVKRDAVKTFISKKVSEKIGDKTQQIYDTGDAFFEAFQNSTDESSAKLKSTVKTGPIVTEQTVADKSLGKKVGEVQTSLKSIKGISSVKVNTNYFWVSSVPSDPNKVQIEITVEE